MFLTRECDYAIRVVRDLADQEIKSVKTICEREQIPYSFAYKILKKLEHAGLVYSYRGAVGGYQLAKEHKNITLLDIVSAMDTQLFLNECLQEGYICGRNMNNEPCNVHRELIRIQAILFKALSEKTMDELR